MSPRTTAARMVGVTGVLVLLLASMTACPREARDVDDADALAQGRCVRPAPGAPGREFGRCMRERLAYGGPPGSVDTAQLVCHECEGDNVRVRMLLEARQGSVNFNPEDRDPANAGVVLARLRNVDSITFADLRLDTAHTAYWWWRRAGNNRHESRIYIVDARNEVVDSLPIFVAYCRHDGFAEDRAEWNRPHPPEQCEQLLGNNNWWVSCLRGCCTGSLTTMAAPQ